MAIEVGNKFSSLSVTNELKQITKLFASSQIVTGDTWATAWYRPILVHVSSRRHTVIPLRQRFQGREVDKFYK